MGIGISPLNASMAMSVAKPRQMPGRASFAPFAPRFKSDQCEASGVVSLDCLDPPRRKTPQDYRDGIRFISSIVGYSLLGNLARQLTRFHPGFQSMREEMERRAIFQPTVAASLHRLKSPELRQKIGNERFFLSADGTRIHYWYVPARNNKPTIVYAHGNQGNMNDRECVIKAFTDAGFGFFAFDPRSYGRSSGKASEQGLYTDFESASDFVAVGLGVPVSRQIAIGESLGGAVVVDVAQRRRFKTVVLCATFTSIPDVFAHLSKRMKLLNWLLPSEQEITQRFESIKKVHHIQSPLIIIHGDKDMVVPHEFSRKLYDNATGTPVKRYMLVKGADHGYNHMPLEELARRLDVFLYKLDNRNRTA